MAYNREDKPREEIMDWIRKEKLKVLIKETAALWAILAGLTFILWEVLNAIAPV